MQLNGSEIILECLKEQGVDTIFGYPGGTILNVYDAIYKYGDQFRHVLTSHEQGAAHAADGYARATGKVGVCMATSGPGATNLVTGIATASHGQRECAPPWQGQLPGGGYRGHHHAGDKAQLYCERCQSPGGYDPPGLPDRQIRPSRPGAGGCDQRCDGGHGRI